MGRPKKCLICGESIVDEQGVPYKGRFAHSKCFNATVKLLQTSKKKQIESNASSKTSKRKPLAELKDAISEEEYQKKKDYYSYLRNLLSQLDQEITAKVYAVTEDYIKRYNFTFDNMRLTLIYLNEIIGKDLTGDVVGLIPYYYDEAVSFFQKVKNIEKVNAHADISQMYCNKTIFIKPRKNTKKLLDIESIEGGS